MTTWQITRRNGLPDAVVATDPDMGSVPIAKIVFGTDHEAHALLIAAAPDMLAALRRAERLILSMSYAHCDEYADIVSAIAKATGA